MEGCGNSYINIKSIKSHQRKRHKIFYSNEEFIEKFILNEEPKIEKTERVIPPPASTPEKPKKAPSKNSVFCRKCDEEILLKNVMSHYLKKHPLPKPEALCLTSDVDSSQLSANNESYDTSDVSDNPQEKKQESPKSRNFQVSPNFIWGKMIFHRACGKK